MLDGRALAGVVGGDNGVIHVQDLRGQAFHRAESMGDNRR
jgi:hypothetical protein